MRLDYECSCHSRLRPCQPPADHVATRRRSYPGLTRSSRHRTKRGRDGGSWLGAAPPRLPQPHGHLCERSTFFTSGRRPEEETECLRKSPPPHRREISMATISYYVPPDGRERPGILSTWSVGVGTKTSASSRHMREEFKQAVRHPKLTPDTVVYYGTPFGDLDVGSALASRVVGVMNRTPAHSQGRDRIRRPKGA